METHRNVKDRLVTAARSEHAWHAFKKDLESQRNKNLVDVKFSVTYDELGHDIVLQASVTVTDPKTYLLQIFLQDIATGIWIPEFQPWELSAVEFQPESRVTTALCGLVDSKWRAEDSGAKYEALLWGYVGQDGATPLQFGPYTEEFVYP